MPAANRRRVKKDREIRSLKPGAGVLGFYEKLVEAELEDWFFYRIEKGIPHVKICSVLVREHGIAATPQLIWKTAVTKRRAYENRQARKELEDRLINPDNRETTTALLEEGLQTMAALRDMKPKEVTDALMLLHRRKELEVRKIEAMRKLYDLQFQAATFCVDVLMEDAKLEEFRRLAADRAMTGPEFAERVRRIMYGENTVPKPAGETMERLAAGIEWVEGKPAIEEVP